MIGVRQAGRVHEMGVFHAQPCCLLVHQVSKGFLCHGNAFGQRNTGIVTRLDNHSVQQLVHRHRGVGLYEHARAFGFPRFGTYWQHLIQFEVAVPDRLEGQVGSHQLGQRSGFNTFIPTLLRQNLAGVEILEQVCLGSQGRRWRNIIRQQVKREKQCKKKSQITHDLLSGDNG